MYFTIDKFHTLEEILTITLKHGLIYTSGQYNTVVGIKYDSTLKMRRLLTTHTSLVLTPIVFFKHIELRIPHSFTVIFNVHNKRDTRTFDLYRVYVLLVSYRIERCESDRRGTFVILLFRPLWKEDEYDCESYFGQLKRIEVGYRLFWSTE